MIYIYVNIYVHIYTHTHHCINIHISHKTHTHMIHRETAFVPAVWQRWSGQNHGAQNMYGVAGWAPCGARPHGELMMMMIVIIIVIVYIYNYIYI